MSDTRPCGGCDRYRPGEPYDIALDCRICWLFHNDDRYRQLWSDASQPSLLTRATSLATAVVRHAAGGFQQTSEAEYAERMAICKGCEHFTGPSKYFSGGSCKKCGCSFKAKASMRTERCPLGKWPKLSS